MRLVEEDIPLMALAEDGEDRQVYAYQAGTWMLATLLPGVVLLGLAIWLHATFAEMELLVTLPLFLVGFLLLYSTLYSLSADQWLMFDGTDNLVRFHKKNLYGRIDWELPASDFNCIRVVPQKEESHWVLELDGTQHQRLLFGESAFKKMSQKRAITLAEKAGKLTGIRVETGN